MLLRVMLTVVVPVTHTVDSIRLGDTIAPGNAFVMAFGVIASSPARDIVVAYTGAVIDSSNINIPIFTLFILFPVIHIGCQHT